MTTNLNRYQKKLIINKYLYFFVNAKMQFKFLYFALLFCFFFQVSLNCNIVLDYASNGQLIEWNEDESIFYYVKDPENKAYLSEEKLRTIFRDCLLGLYYCNIDIFIC